VKSPVLRRRDAAAYLGVSLRTLRNLMTKPGFPAHVQITDLLIGWFQHDLDAWLASRKVEKAS
jgi:predicted DNA-binding transcriptional regulator AlpA